MYTMSSATAARSGGRASGGGSPEARPSGVVLTRTVHSADPLGGGPFLESAPAIRRARAHRHRRSALPRGADRRPRAAPRAQHQPPARRRLEIIERGEHAGHIRVVTDRGAILAPEGVAGIQPIHQRLAAVHGARGGFLVGHGDVAAAARAAQGADQARHVVGGAADGNVDRFEAEDAEGRVLDGRGKRVSDGVAQDGEDARGAVDHRTVPATLLTTAEMSSCSSVNVAR
jgi:hypothetical protein